MTTVSLGEAKDKLSALVDSAETTHDIITITRHGKPAAVLMSTEDLESLQETIFWLSRAQTSSAVTDADDEYATGQTTSLDDLRAEFGIPGDG
jgi:antitoxin YefM